MENLMRAVRQLYGAMERFDASAASRLGVDRSGLRAINSMERGAISAGALSEQLGLTTGAVTALLDRLEIAGHVQRTVVLGDARRRDANLSSKTRKSANAVYSRLANSIEKNISELPEKNMQVILQGLLSIAAAFDHASVHNSKSQ
jgi:DNA-binding MarR family transcriptional regulator